MITFYLTINRNEISVLTIHLLQLEQTLKTIVWVIKINKQKIDWVKSNSLEINGNSVIRSKLVSSLGETIMIVDNSLW